MRPRQCSLFVRAVLAVVCASGAAGLPAWGQVSSTVDANLEQTAGVASSHRAPLTIDTMARPTGFDTLLLDGGQTLEMTVFGAPEMSRTLQIDREGKCVIPLVGSVALAGQTTREGEATIRQLLIDRKMFNDPQVTLQITAYASRNVFVAGEVESPGKLELLAPESLLNVLAMAGGETPAAGGEISIHHRTVEGIDKVRHVPYSSKMHDSDIAANTVVYPGETVNVSRAGVIYVLGAVTRPGGYLMVNGGKLSVPEAISLANGTTLLASTRTAVIVRRQNDMVDRMEVALDDEQKGRKASTALVDGDILYVGTSKLKSTFVNTSGLITSLSGAAIYAGVAR